MSISPVSWKRVTELFEQALAYAPAERAEFLRVACAGDFELQQEIESLLAEHEADDESFLASAVAAVADQLVEEIGRLEVGRQLGPYRIEQRLGGGGMGEVYVARDKLGRQVALKLLTQKFLAHESGKARFEQEARTLLALNHPHIVTLHDIDQIDGINYIVSELVEGETLRRRLDKEPISLP